MIEYVMPFVVVVLALLSYFVGRRIHEAAHCMVPFNDPVSLILLLASLVPMILGIWGLATVDPFGVWYLASLFAFWGGYSIGYCSVRADLVYYAVHQIVERTQTIDYLVVYYNREGRMCWQPQSFRAICKSMIWHVDNPLELRQVQRTRHVEVHQFLRPKVTVDAIDLAGMEISEYTEKRRWVEWKVTALRFTPSPHCTDSPYDWIANALGYEELFQQYSSLQVENLETNAKLRTAAMRGGGELLSAMGAKTPSTVVMEQLGLDLEEMFGPRLRRIRKETEKERRRLKEVTDDD